jgi:hypothetical protein
LVRSFLTVGTKSRIEGRRERYAAPSSVAMDVPPVAPLFRCAAGHLTFPAQPVGHLVDGDGVAAERGLHWWCDARSWYRRRLAQAVPAVLGVLPDEDPDLVQYACEQVLLQPPRAVRPGNLAGQCRRLRQLVDDDQQVPPRQRRRAQISEPQAQRDQVVLDGLLVLIEEC